MNKIYKLISSLCTAAVILTIASCSKDDPFVTGGENAPHYSVSLAKLKVEALNKENIIESTRAGEDIDVDDFTVEFRRGDVVEKSFRYGDMPSAVDLREGSYTAVAYYGSKELPQGWNAPYFEGKSEFMVGANEVNEVEPIVATFSNVKVTILFDEALAAVLSDDAKVNVVVGENGNLDFTSGETRSGYFAYVDDSPSLVARFSGQVEGIAQTMTKIHTDVRPGNHYRITFRLRTPGTSGEGTLDRPDLRIDATVTVDDMTISVDSGDDVIDDDLRPSQGDEPGPPPSNDGPEISAKAPIDLNGVNVVVPGMECVLYVKSETGIETFTVDIDSETLTAEVLGGVGLSTHLDLVNPGSLREGLESLDFPVGEEVKGSKEVKFDITSFLDLLGIYGAANHNFILTVTDAGGKTVKTLKLRTN